MLTPIELDASKDTLTFQAARTWRTARLDHTAVDSVQLPLAFALRAIIQSRSAQLIRMTLFALYPHSGGPWYTGRFDWYPKCR